MPASLLCNILSMPAPTVVSENTICALALTWLAANPETCLSEAQRVFSEVNNHALLLGSVARHPDTSVCPLQVVLHELSPCYLLALQEWHRRHAGVIDADKLITALAIARASGAQREGMLHRCYQGKYRARILRTCPNMPEHYTRTILEVSEKDLKSAIDEFHSTGKAFAFKITQHIMGFVIEFAVETYENDQDRNEVCLTSRFQTECGDERARATALPFDMMWYTGVRHNTSSHCFPLWTRKTTQFALFCRLGCRSSRRTVAIQSLCKSANHCLSAFCKNRSRISGMTASATSRFYTSSTSWTACAS